MNNSTFKRITSNSIIVKIIGVIAGLFPLTIQGTITLLVTTIFLRAFGYGSMDLVVFAITICALTILIFCLFCVIISGLLVQRKIQKKMGEQRIYYEKISVEAEYPNETGFKLPPLNILPLVQLSWRIAYPDYIETRLRATPDGMLSEEIIPAKRCNTEYVTREFTVSDVLGFCRYSWLQKQTVNCLALPKKNTLKSIPLLRSLNAEDGLPNPSGEPEGDRMEIRPYTPGDSVRNIMWKVYARTRQLNIRLAEKSVFHDTKMMAYLLSSKNDEAAAAVARMALERGTLGEDWLFGADGSEKGCDTLASALEAIAKSRSIESEYEYGLENFLTSSAGRSNTHCIVFAAAEYAPWLPQLRRTIGNFPNQFSLVLGTDGFEEPNKPNLWQNLLFRTPPASRRQQKESGSKSEMLKLLTELGQLVKSMIVIDRKSSLSFDKKLRRI